MAITRAKPNTLMKLARILVYASVLLGILMLVELYSVVPIWLFYSVFAGWIAYLIVALLIAKNRKIAYPLAIVLAVLILLVAIPQPEHQNMIESGFSLGTMTFLIGSMLQVGVIVTISAYMLKERNIDGIGSIA